MPENVRIVVVDDHPLYREGVVKTLNEHAAFNVIGIGETAEMACRLADEMAPDVIFLDISMPGGGLNALKHVSENCPATAPVMLTASENENDVLAALQGGAKGYVLKGVSGHELVAIAANIATGGSYVAPQLAGQMLVAMQSAGSTPDAKASLTVRETEILKFVSGGLSNKEVARNLDLQEKTVKHHMTSIMGKLKVRNRVEAAVMANKLWPRTDA